jgi:uncharacterized protein YunC (DUF1805 family)
MKKSALLILLFVFSTPFILLGEESMNGELHFELAKPLLIIKERNGFLACAYINPETCNKTGEACAIVSGVSDYADMKKAKIIAISESAEKLGIKIGDPGQKALEKFK